MNITLTVVVAAIVILITALVVLTIFGGGMTNVGTVAQAASMCAIQCQTSCDTTNERPLTWNIKNLRYTNKDGASVEGSCADAVGAAASENPSAAYDPACDC